MQTLEENRPENYPDPFINKTPQRGPLNNIVPFAPDNPPWSSLSAFLMWLFSVAMIVIVPTAGLIFYLVSTGVNISDSSKMAEVEKDPAAMFVNVILIIPAHILTLIACWLVITNLNKHSFTEMLGWKWGKPGFWPSMAMFFGILVFLMSAAYLFTTIFGKQETGLEKIITSSRSTAIAIAIMATFTAPLVEEVVYRGLMYSAFQRSLGAAWAVALVTLCFAAVHFPQYYQSTATLLVITLMSLILTLVRVASGNLWPCIVLHTIINGLQSIGIVAGAYNLGETNNAVPEPAASFIMRLFH